MKIQPEYTAQCSAGTRVYYFDVHKDRKGQRYLSITEIPTDGHPGSKDRRKVFVHESNLEGFLECLQDAAAHMKKGDGNA